MAVEKFWAELHSHEDVIGALLITPKGQIRQSSLGGFQELEQTARHCAEMLTLSIGIASQTQRGTLDQVYIRAQQGYVIGIPVGINRILVIVTREQAKLGFILPRSNPWKDDPRLVEPVFPRKPPGNLSARATPDEDA